MRSKKRERAARRLLVGGERGRGAGRRGHFKSKLDVEDHLKASGLNLDPAPVAFFENYDDPQFQRPKGLVKGLWQADLR